MTDYRALKQVSWTIFREFEISPTPLQFRFCWDCSQNKLEFSTIMAVFLSIYQEHINQVSNTIHHRNDNNHNNMRTNFFSMFWFLSTDEYSLSSLLIKLNWVIVLANECNEFGLESFSVILLISLIFYLCITTETRNIFTFLLSFLPKLRAVVLFFRNFMDRTDTSQAKYQVHTPTHP